MHVSELGAYLESGLEELVEHHPSLLKEVRGLGLMLGLYCVTDAGDVIKRLQDHKLLVVKAGANSIRLLPALNVKKSEIDTALDIIAKVLLEIENG